MATLNLQPGFAPADFDVRQPSRRSMLGLLAAAPVVALIPAAVIV